MLLSSVVFSVFIGAGHTLDLATSTTLLVIFNLIKGPLIQAPNVLGLMCLTWGASDLPSEDQKILKEVSFKVKRGEFVSIIGDVGSGKSSLLCALIGEMLSASSDGKVAVSAEREIAYAQHSPWI
jgi:ABC-type protease/lipase transport system fused ATPase/permease subunit